MTTVPYKGKDWPVSPAWAEKFLTGPFAELSSWETGSQANSSSLVGLWGRLWALLRKSDETLADRTRGMTHEEVKAAMKDPVLGRKIMETLTPEELLELRAVEAHIIIRRRADNLLGRDLEELDIPYIDWAHGQGFVADCGCDLLVIMDDDKSRRTNLGEEVEGVMKPHYPAKLCEKHAHLHGVLSGAGRWHNLPLADRLAAIHEAVLNEEAQAETAAAA